MYAFLSKLLISGKLKFVPGEINFLGEYMTIFPLSTLKYMTDNALKKGKRNVMDLYMAGWHYGYEFTYNLSAKTNLKKFEERYKIIMDIASLIGFGDYQTLTYKKEKYSKFKNIKNPFGLLYYPRNEPVCHFVRGMNAGGSTIVHSRFMNSIELECTAQNKQYCLFADGGNEYLKKLDNKKFKEQLDVKYLREKQLEIIESFGHDPKIFTTSNDILANKN